MEKLWQGCTSKDEALIMPVKASGYDGLVVSRKQHLVLKRSANCFAEGIKSRSRGGICGL